MLRSRWFMLAAAAAMLLGSADAKAQFESGFANDPFALYYGFFLPRQQLLANQPGPEATLNANVAARQSYAVTNRGSLDDITSPFSTNENPFLDQPLGAGGGTGARGERVPRLSTNRGLPVSHVNGAGPPAYYNRVVRYYPNARPGVGANQNVAVIRNRNIGPNIPYNRATPRP